MINKSGFTLTPRQRALLNAPVEELVRVNHRTCDPQLYMKLDGQRLLPPAGGLDLEERCNLVNLGWIPVHPWNIAEWRVICRKI